MTVNVDRELTFLHGAQRHGTVVHDGSARGDTVVSEVTIVLIGAVVYAEEILRD